MLASASGMRGLVAHRRWHYGLLVLALVALWLGWRAFWFLTDDAFITFRYIANRHAGLGYVWNAPPFAPVEGYSNFLWMVVLDVVWTVFGVDPPSAANVVSLICAALMLWRVWAWASAEGSTWRVLITLVLLISNGTFLAWSSSGLETALFNVLLFAWFEQLCRWPEVRLGQLRFVGVAMLASLAALTRPDGLLAWGATGLLLLLPDRSPKNPRSIHGKLGALLALALVPLHALWRHATYGVWLPNTYYAKHVAPWPEAGVRYLACFVFEYGYWCCGLLALGFAAWRWRAAIHWLTVTRAAAVATLVAHTGYYVLRVGGDHFEYRVLSQWVPVLALGWAAMLTTSELKRGVRVVLILLSLVASLPVQWTHALASQRLTLRSETWKLKLAIAPLWGVQWAPIVAFDETQAWLIDHHVGMRRQEHQVFGEDQRARYPSRQWVEHAELIPVLSMSTVGVTGWAYPNVAIIDVFGLNDRVIARNPVAADHVRLMAHDRSAPPGYVECFRPNVEVGAHGVALITPRNPPLTADDVRSCERDFMALVQGLQDPLPTFEGTPRPPREVEELVGPADVLTESFRPTERVGFAFGAGPTDQLLPSQQPVVGFQGPVLNSFHRGDVATGMISLAIPKGTREVALRVAGGSACDSVFVAVADGARLVSRACGRDSEQARAVVLEVGDAVDPKLVVVDRSQGGWGHVIVGDIQWKR